MDGRVLDFTRVSLVDELHRRNGGPFGPSECTRMDIAKLVDHLEAVITETLASGGRVSLQGFGTFTIRERKARTGQNPRDRSKVVEIPAKRVAKFSPGSHLRDALNDSAR